jgi:virginiamycin B lyase
MGTVSEYQIVSPDSQPNDLVAGPDGNMWFTESTDRGAVIGRITPAGKITKFALPDVSEQVNETFAIAAGRDGSLWFTDQLRGGGPWTSRIGRITTAGNIHYFALPTPEVQADDIALGADGDMWFTAAGSNIQRPSSASGAEIGRIAPDGHVKQFAVTDEPNEIVRGKHNTMLFTSFTAKGNRIGRITANGKISYIQLPSPNNCFVPRLAGHTLRAAEQRLRRAQCRLGKIIRHKDARRTPVVISQRPTPQTTLPHDSRVLIQLG